MTKKVEEVKSGNAVWYRTYIIFAVVIIGFAFFAIPKSSKGIKNERTAIVSLKRENSTLRNILAAEMVARGDSMTVEQRLNWSEFEQYINKAYNAKIVEEAEAYKWKVVEENKAYEQKEAADTKNFVIYSVTKTKVLKDLENGDPKNFLVYAMISFRQDNYSTEENNREHLYQIKKNIEKIPSIASYVSLVQSAWLEKCRQEKILSAVYEKKKIEIEKAYQPKIDFIGEKYKQKIKNKKISFGF